MKITVVTGQFEIMKASVAGLSADRRLQAVLVAFCFGAFMEGAAGFGAPVAISAAFLVGLGFDPFKAAVLCLIANTAPVAWGSIGTPILTLSKVTGLDVEALSATSGRILPFLSVLIPFWLVRVMTAGARRLPSGCRLPSSAERSRAVQFLWSNFVGFELVDIVAAVASAAAGVIVMHLWKPRETWRFERDGRSCNTRRCAHGRRPRRRRVPGCPTACWSPPFCSGAFRPSNTGHTGGQGVARRTNFVETGHAEPAPPRCERGGSDRPPRRRNRRISRRPSWTSFRSRARAPRFSRRRVISGLLLGLSPAAMVRLLVSVVQRMAPALAAIFCMLSLGFVTKYSGMDAVLGLAFTRTGPVLYPIFGTLLGWLGVALTGSDTSSNVLFGDLQKITATKLGLNPILMASANSTGGVMGKMIDAQSIVVAAAATGEGGREGELLRTVFWHSLVLALIVGLIVWTYAHITPGAVVGGSQ